jgi:hypothetical protein
MGCFCTTRLMAQKTARAAKMRKKGTLIGYFVVKASISLSRPR